LQNHSGVGGSPSPQPNGSSTAAGIATVNFFGGGREVELVFSLFSLLSEVVPSMIGKILTSENIVYNYILLVKKDSIFANKIT
jgi:hypothetical protein